MTLRECLCLHTMQYIISYLHSYYAQYVPICISLLHVGKKMHSLHSWDYNNILFILCMNDEQAGNMYSQPVDKYLHKIKVCFSIDVQFVPTQVLIEHFECRDDEYFLSHFDLLQLINCGLKSKLTSSLSNYDVIFDHIIEITQHPRSGPKEGYLVNDLDSVFYYLVYILNESKCI